MSAGWLGLGLVAGWLWPLVGALLGFLIWDWSPAQVFMGDVGSTCSRPAGRNGAFA